AGEWPFLLGLGRSTPQGRGPECGPNRRAAPIETKRPRLAPGPLNFVEFVVTGQAMAPARFPSCPGLVCGGLAVLASDWRPGQEEAQQYAPVATGVCAELPVGLHGSAARLFLAAGVASADYK